MISTVHIDRQGYVDTLLCNTRKATLDAKRYPGTLMEVEGPVCVGWHWDGQKFSLPPPRISPEAVRAERDRRVDGPFPERFRAQITALGGDNAVSVSNYVSAVFKVAEAFGDDAPQDYRDDRHWPRVPKLRDLPVPQRVAEISPVTGAPVNITVAPVIHATPAEPKALLVEHSVPSPGEYGLDRSDPLYDRKVRLIRFLEDNEPKFPSDEAWKDALGHLAALHTRSQSLDELERREEAVFAHIEGQAG